MVSLSWPRLLRCRCFIVRKGCFVNKNILNAESYQNCDEFLSSVVSLTSMLQKLPLNSAPGPDFISAEHLLYAGGPLCLYLSVFLGCLRMIRENQNNISCVKCDQTFLLVMIER